MSDSDSTFFGPFEPPPETLVGCGCATNWHRFVMRLNTTTGRMTETRICGQCGDARVLRSEIEVTDETRARLAEMVDEAAEDAAAEQEERDDHGDDWQQ